MYVICLGACHAGSRGIGSSLFQLALSMLPSVASQLPAAGAKPSPDAQLPSGKAVLITGCQAEETSADACPSGKVLWQVTVPPSAL